MSSDALIPIVQPTLPPWADVEADLRAAWANPIVTVGRFVRALEVAVAERVGVPHTVAVSSCTSGLILAIRALGLSGEVILPAFTWTATGEALLWTGIEPVFVDVEPGRLTLDPAAVEAAITERTTAIMPVTVFGTPPDIDALQAIAARHDLKMLYDTAQGLGATYHGHPLGGFGDIEVFSMSPTKVATAIEGGLLTTHNAALADRLRSLRDYGKGQGGDITALGLSARQSELNALVGLHSVRRLDRYVAARAKIVSRYVDRLSALPGVGFQTQPRDTTTSWNYATIFVDPAAARMSRDALQAALLERRIQAKRYFYPSLHLQTVFSAYRERFQGRLPVSERASAEGLALPLFSHMTDAQTDRVCDAIEELLR